VTIDATDDFGNTALHYAAYHGHLHVVQELLKSNPRKDLQNSYGHTAASYAASNKHKGIADLLSRAAPSRKEKERLDFLEQARQRPPTADAKDQADLGDLDAIKKKLKEEKHVKGHAEDLHKGDTTAFAPKTELAGAGGEGGGGPIADAERRSLEEQIARLKHLNDEAELKAQRRIVELLEKNANHQKDLDDAVRESRALRLNQTELQLHVSDIESRHRSSELRASEEKERADRATQERASLAQELERHRTRTTDAERERDVHAEAARRHEETIRRKQQEIDEQLARMEQHARDMAALREELKGKEEVIARLRSQLGATGTQDALPPSQPPPPTPPGDVLDGSAASPSPDASMAAGASPSDASGSGVADGGTASGAVSDAPSEG